MPKQGVFFTFSHMFWAEFSHNHICFKVEFHIFAYVLPLSFHIFAIYGRAFDCRFVIL